MGTTSGRPKEHVGSIGVHTWERRYGGVVNVNREAAAASAPVVCNEGRKRILPIFEGGRVGKPSAVCGVYHVLLTLNKGAHMGAGGLERAFEKPKERLWPKRERAQGVTVEMSARKQHVLERGTNDDGAGSSPKSSARVCACTDGDVKSGVDGRHRRTAMTRGRLKGQVKRESLLV